VHGELVPVPRPGLQGAGVFATASRTTHVGLGLAGLVVQGAHVALGSRPRAQAAPSRGAALWATAAFGLAIELERRIVHAAESFVATGSTAVRGASRLPVVRAPADRFEAWLVRWSTEAQVQQRQNRADAELVVRRVVRDVTDAVMAHIDFGRIVEQIPMDEIVDRIDIEAIIAKIDIGALVNGVVKEVDLAGIIRESTEGVTAEAVDAVRSQTVKTDVFVAKVVDRILLRRGPRDLSLAEPATDAPGPTP
jgi:hypothetical protein